MLFATSQSRMRAKILNMDPSKTSDHIQIKIKMQNLSQEPPVSSKAPNQDLKDMDVLCTFKIKIESQNLEHGYIKNNDRIKMKIESPNSELGVPKTTDHIQIKIKMQNPSQEPPACSKAPKQDLKYLDVLFPFKLR